MNAAMDMKLKRASLVLGLTLGCVSAMANPIEGEVATTIENFSHRNALIQAGDTLAWTNMDAVPHTVTLGSGKKSEPGFDSGLIGPGQTFALKFDQAGTYSFTCTLHPGMDGEVVVTE